LTFDICYSSLNPFFQNLLNPFDRLFDPGFILHQSKPHKAFSTFTKTDPRGSIASQLFFELTHTNSLNEGGGSGEFEDYRYDWELKQIETNGLCQVDIAIAPSSRSQSGGYSLQLVMYLPQMQQRLGGAAPPPR